MDLFLDEYYKKDCGNKINYYKLLKGTSSSTVPNYTFTKEPTGRSVYHTDNIVLVVGDDLADIHLYKDATNEYCYEIMISAYIKKFVL